MAPTKKKTRRSDNLSLEQRSNAMRAVKSSNSRIEQVLRKELWRRGLRYRKNFRPVFGTPDIVFIGRKVAVFCDSEFWHGYRWKSKRSEIKSNQAFWYQKIEKNIKRDRLVTRHLRKNGWIVLRFWGHQISKDLNKCALQIEVACKTNRASS